VSSLSLEKLLPTVTVLELTHMSFQINNVHCIFSVSSSTEKT